MNAAGVAVAWIGAVFGPLFLVIWIVDRQVEHLILACFLLTITLTTIASGFNALRRRGPRSDTLAYLVIPFVLLSLGIALAVYETI